MCLDQDTCMIPHVSFSSLKSIIKYSLILCALPTSKKMLNDTYLWLEVFQSQLFWKNGSYSKTLGYTEWWFFLP